MKKKVFGSWIKLLATPVTRPAGDIKESVKGISKSWEALKSVKGRKEEDARLVSEYLAGMSPEEKFREVYEKNSWTEPELADQLSAAKNTRLASLGLVILLFPVLIWIVATSPLWIMIFSGAVAVVLFAACVAQAVRFAWWEVQIEERACFPMREMLSRKDLYQRLFRL